MNKIILTVLLTLLGNILCLPLWTECDYAGFVQTLFNKEARLDIRYTGLITAAEPFYLKSQPSPLNVSWPYECDNKTRYVAQSLRARGKWQKISLQIQPHHDGKITLLFKGPDVRDDYGELHSILTDWRDVKINDRAIFTGRKTVSSKKPFTAHVIAKKGEVLQVGAEFRRHHFSSHDFTGLSSGKIWFIMTGNILFFLLIYRLLTYLAIRGGGIRAADTLLLIGFFLLLFIPMLDISDATRSFRENRTLAIKPEMKEILRGNTNTGRRYEKWFNDHFLGRPVLMQLHDVIRNRLSHVIRTEKVIYFKENKWDFLMPLVSNLDCRPSSLQSIARNLVQLNQFCQQHKIKLYVFEVPRKEVIYKEIIRNKYGFDEKQFVKVSRVQETIRNEARKHHIPYVYPYKALRDAVKSDFVFFKCSHHWTDWGAYVGYRELIKEIRKDFPSMPFVSLNDYRKSRSGLYRDDYLRSHRPTWQYMALLNGEHLNDYWDRTFYNYYDHKNGDKMLVRVGERIKEFSYPSGKHRVMLIGSSQNENLCQFLPYSAAFTKYIRLNMGKEEARERYKVLKLYKDVILSFRPDILILSIHTDNLTELRNLCSTK